LLNSHVVISQRYKGGFGLSTHVDITDVVSGILLLLPTDQETFSNMSYV